MGRTTKHDQRGGRTLNNSINGLDWKDIYMIFYISFSSVHEIIFQTDYTLDNKTSDNTWKIIIIVQNMFSKENEVKLKFNTRRKTGTLRNMYKLNNTFLNDQWVYEELKTKSESTLRWMKRKVQHTKVHRMQWKQLSGGVL